MNDGELNDGQLSDGELNDSKLGRELSALTPEPAADYWTRIDAMLTGVEAERRGGPTAADGSAVIGTTSRGEASRTDDRADTDDNVIRLTDMHQPRDLVNRFNRRGGLVLAAAASLIALLAVAGLLVLRDDSTTIDAADDGTTESTPLPDEGSTDMTETPDDGTDGLSAVAPITATYCFYEANSALVEGEQAVRLVVRSDGTAEAAERYVRPNGQTIGVNTATGIALDESSRRFAMTTEQGGEPYTTIWRITETGLSTDIESFVPNGDCADVDETLAEVEMPQPVVPDPESVDPTLDPGTYCWRGDQMIQGIYQLTVGDDGTVSVAAYTTISANDPVLTMIETGTGTFVTANEIAFNVDRWTREGVTTDSMVYRINGGDLQPMAFATSVLAPPVDCDALDEWRLPAEGLNIYTDEELTFEPGTSETTVEGGFVRGELAVYRVDAEQGQTMTVTISSPEDNAAVTVYNPERFAILDNEDGSGSRSVVLPDSGVYQVVVSGTRGNVSYTLDIEVR